MPAATLTLKRARLRLRTLYTCVICGSQAQGEGADVDLDGLHHEPDAFAAYIQNLVVSNTHMPVGWAGYGTHKHICPKCKQ